MAVTPNFSWPVPVATDYVKDGWEAISDLGNAIDTTVAGLGGGGLATMTPTSIVKGASGTASVTAKGTVNFSATESISLNGVFNSTYKNYRVILSVDSGTTNAEVRLRYRASGTDNSANEYRNEAYRVIDNNSSNILYASQDTYTRTGLIDGTMFLQMDVGYPNLALYTTHNGLFTYGQSGSFVSATTFFGAKHSVSSVMDGISFFTSTGTFTGNVAVFGYEL